MRFVLRLTTCAYLVLAVLTGVPAGASRAVLCLGPDGHVAIEMGNGRCAEYAPPGNDAGEPAGTEMLPTCCGECVDIPVGTPVLSERHGRSPAVSSPTELAPPLTLALLTSESPDAVTNARSAPGVDSHPAFPPSRSTILRN